MQRETLAAVQGSPRMIGAELLQVADGWRDVYKRAATGKRLDDGLLAEPFQMCISRRIRMSRTCCRCIEAGDDQTRMRWAGLKICWWPRRRVRRC